MKKINGSEERLKVKLIRKLRGNRRGQFTIIAAILISITVITIAFSASQLAVFQQNFRYQPAKETVTEITSDLNRALTYALSSASKTYNDTGRTLQAGDKATSVGVGNISLWQRSVISSHSNLGLQMKIEPPGGGGATDVSFEMKWSGNPGSSKAETKFELNATTYGLTGWVAGDTILRSLYVDEQSFDSDQVLNTTTFKFSLTNERGRPIVGLQAKDISANMKPLGSGWKPTNVKTLQYIGAGKYVAVIAPYFPLFWLQKNITVVTPVDRIYVLARLPLPPDAKVILDSAGPQGGHAGTIKFGGETYSSLPHTTYTPPSRQSVEFTVTGYNFDHWKLDGRVTLVSGTIWDNPILVDIEGNANITAYYSKLSSRIVAAVTKSAPPTVEAGEAITITATVSKTGDNAWFTSISDVPEPDTPFFCTPIAVGGLLTSTNPSTTCVGSYNASSTAGTITDKVRVVLTDQNGATSTAEDTATTNVIKVGASVTKLALSTVQVGGTIQVWAIVTNNGTTDARFVSIYDDPPVVNFFCSTVAEGETLMVGQSTLCTGTYTAPDTAGEVKDNVTVVLTDPLDTTFTAWAVATTNVVLEIPPPPAGSLAVSVSKLASPTVEVGGTVEVVAIVSNTGTIDASLTLTDVPEVTNFVCADVLIGGILAAGTSTTCRGSYIAPSTPIVITDTVTAELTDPSNGEKAYAFATATTNVVPTTAMPNVYFFSKDVTGATDNIGTITIQGVAQPLPYTTALSVWAYPITFTLPDDYFFIGWIVNDWTKVQLDNTAGITTTLHVLLDGGNVTALYMPISASSEGGGLGGPYTELYVWPIGQNISNGLELTTHLGDPSFLPSQTSHGNDKELVDLYMDVPSNVKIRFDGPAYYYLTVSQPDNAKDMTLFIEYTPRGSSTPIPIGKSDPVPVSRNGKLTPVRYAFFLSYNEGNPLDSNWYGPGGTIHVHVEIAYTKQPHGTVHLYYGEPYASYINVSLQTVG